MSNRVVAIVFMSIVLIASSCGGASSPVGGVDAGDDIDQVPPPADSSTDEPATNSLNDTRAIDIARDAAATEGLALDGLDPRVVVDQGFWYVFFESPDDSRSVEVYLDPSGTLAGIGSSGF